MVSWLAEGHPTAPAALPTGLQAEPASCGTVSGWLGPLFFFFFRFCLDRQPAPAPKTQRKTGQRRREKKKGFYITTSLPPFYPSLRSTPTPHQHKNYHNDIFVFLRFSSLRSSICRHRTGLSARTSVSLSLSSSSARAQFLILFRALSPWNSCRDGVGAEECGVADWVEAEVVRRLTHFFLQSRYALPPQPQHHQISPPSPPESTVNRRREEHPLEVIRAHILIVRIAVEAL